MLQPGLCSHNGSLCPANASLSPMVNMSLPEQTPEAGTETDTDLLLSIEATEMRLNPDYVKFYLIYTNFFILSLIPFILLIIMNICIYRTVRFKKYQNTRITTSCYCMYHLRFKHSNRWYCPGWCEYNSFCVLISILNVNFIQSTNNKRSKSTLLALTN